MIVNPILEAISNVSAMPGTPFVGQSVAVQRGLGGFAATLAGAKGLSSPSLATASEVEGTDTDKGEAIAGKTATTANLNVGSASPLPRKSSNNTLSGAANLFPAPVPGFLPAMEIQIPVLQPILPSLTESGLVHNAVSAEISVLVTSASAVSGAASQNIAASFATSEQTLDTAGRASNQLEGADESAFFEAGAPSSNERLSVTASVGGWNGFENLGSAELERRAPSIPSVAPASGVGQPAWSAILPDAVGEIRSTEFAADSPATKAQGTTTQSDEIAESAGRAPAFLAANSGAGTAGPPLASATALQVGQASVSNGIAPDAAAGNEFPAESGTGPALSGTGDERISGLPIVNPAMQLAGGRAPLRLAGAGVAGVVASPGRGAGQSAAAHSSIPASPWLAESGSGNGLAVAAETPFSVFFSGPGPGTESAASALPKIILPVTGTAIRNIHEGSGNAVSAKPPTGGFESGIPQDATAKNNKDTGDGTGNGSLPAATALRGDADLSTASAPITGSQPAAAPVAALPVSSAVVPPLGEQATLTADSSRPDPVQVAPPGSQAGLGVPQTPVAVPGPVQVAQLVTRLGQSEMRIGMNTSAFGSVEVRTVVRASDVGLVIGSEKGDLRTLLANDMPGISNALQQQNLRLNSVNFMQGFAFSSNSSGGGGSQQHSFVPMRGPANSMLSGAAVEDSMEVAAGEFDGGRGSLSILA